MSTSVTITNAGLNLLRDALALAPGPPTGTPTDCAIHYIAVGTGCGTLGSGLTNGSVYTSLSIPAGIPLTLANGRSLTIISPTNSQVVTVNGAVGAGATSITVASFTANANYAAATTAVVPTPAATDTTLHHEAFRKALTVNANGAAAGESLSSLYVSPQDAVGVVICEVGWFAGATASSGANSGVLVGRALYAHTKLATEALQLQADSTI